jgi:hypothetical protein
VYLSSSEEWSGKRSRTIAWSDQMNGRSYMAIERLEDVSKSHTTRRKIVTTGAKLAYAAPLVAATATLESGGAGAVSPNGACTTFVCGNGPCVETPDGFNCFCFETAESPGNGRCTGNFFCSEPTGCTSDADCPGGGTCVINTCCGPQSYCAPPCPGGAATGTGIPAGSGKTASGKVY